MKKQHALLRTISFKPSNFHFKVASATMDVWNGGGHFIFVATLTSLKQIICSHMSRNVQGNVGNELFDSYHHRKTSRPDHKSGHERHDQACSSYLIYWIDWLPLSPIITYFSPFPRQHWPLWHRSIRRTGSLSFANSFCRQQHTLKGSGTKHCNKKRTTRTPETWRW